MEQAGVHIDFENVGFAYEGDAGKLQALADVSFSVNAGESVALIGPSGCGKSTTLHLMAGLIVPDEGRVLIDSSPIAQPRQATAFIQQDLGLFPWKTVLQNASIGLTIRKTPREDALERARAALMRVGLDGFEGAYPRELSGGMRQRLAIARALAMDADLLLMDEPLSAIDALLRERLQDTLLALWRERGHTQVLVTHSIEEAVYLGQHILVFSNRPATVIATIDNPQMGAPSYRSAEDFLAKCDEVRHILETRTNLDQEAQPLSWGASARERAHRSNGESGERR